MQITDACVLVEGPDWGNAQFLGEWLLAAALAEAFWKEARNDRRFQKQVDDVCLCFIPDFGISATVMVMQLQQHRTSFVLRADDELAAEFAMMAVMGFFERKGQTYQMTLPRPWTAERGRAASLAYANTGDDEDILHPEHLVLSFQSRRR
jgi:hypothetical protein